MIISKLRLGKTFHHWHQIKGFRVKAADGVQNIREFSKRTATFPDRSSKREIRVWLGPFTLQFKRKRCRWVPLYRSWTTCIPRLSNTKFSDNEISLDQLRSLTTTKNASVSRKRIAFYERILWSDVGIWWQAKFKVRFPGFPIKFPQIAQRIYDYRKAYGYL